MCQRSFYKNECCDVTDTDIWQSVCVFFTLQVGLCVNETLWHAGTVCVCVFAHCKWGSVSMRLCVMLAQCVCVFLHIASWALCQ